MLKAHIIALFKNVLQGNTSRNTYVGVLMNKRAILCTAPHLLNIHPILAAALCNPLALTPAADCQQNFHYLQNREQCISGLMR